MKKRLIKLGYYWIQFIGPKLNNYFASNVYTPVGLPWLIPHKKIDNIINKFKLKLPQTQKILKLIFGS